MFRNDALKIGVQYMKNLRVKRLAQSLALGASMLATGFFAFSAQATQTVNPFTAATGGTNMNGTTVPFTSNAVTFFGRYSTTTSAAESGLGVKVKYDSTKVTVAVTEEYDGCRIAAAQNQVVATPGLNSQVVMGWIDTSIRTSGAVGWPNVAEPAASGGLAPCLDPGGINGTPAGSATDQKLFKIVATRVGGFTTGTTPISIISDGNFSYAGGSPGFTDKGFTIDAAAAGGSLTLAATPFVSRKTHGAAGTFDLAINPAGAATGTTITVEPRQAQTGSHQIVVNFNSTVTATEFPAANISAAVSAGGSGSRPATATFNGNSMIITVGTTGSPIPNGSRITVTATGVGAAAGVNPTVVVGFLLGDVSGNRTVNSTDVGTVKGQSGVAVTATNYLSDLSANGTINSTDVGTVKGASGSTLN
jgi:hypothetical protein